MFVKKLIKMEFSFDLRRVLRIDADGVAVLDYGTTPTI